MGSSMIWVSNLYFVELHDVGVADELQDLDFSSDALDVALVLDLLFLQDLDGHALLRGHVNAQLDLPESAFSQVVA